MIVPMQRVDFGSNEPNMGKDWGKMPADWGTNPAKVKPQKVTKERIEPVISDLEALGSNPEEEAVESEESSSPVIGMDGLPSEVDKVDPEQVEESPVEIDQNNPFHQAALVFPAMSDEEFSALMGSIRVNGLRNPIVVHDERIVDGRNRYKACLETDTPLKQVPLHEKLGKKKGEPITKKEIMNFVIIENIHRRKLTKSQEAIIAVELVNWSRKKDEEGMTLKQVSALSGGQREDSQAGKSREGKVFRSGQGSGKIWGNHGV